MNSFIDLHVHSTCSDGTYTPTELVHIASAQHLSAFALTDHDTIKGIPEAIEEGSISNMEVIAGIEFSTAYHGQDVHIVGLDIPWESQSFIDAIEDMKQGRDHRNQKMIDRMAADGIEISIPVLKQRFGENTVLTRAHFGRYLMEKGYVNEISEAFQNYIGDHCKYYVPREKISPADCVRLLTRFHAISVLAHPFQYHLSEEGLSQLIHELKKEGLLGIEAMYSTHSLQQERLIRKLARNFGICISGGSDFHGTNKPLISLGTGRGNLSIPYETIIKMRTQNKMRLEDIS